MDNNQYQSTVMVVDDNPTNLSLLLHYLNSSGYRTLIAQDGVGAIEQAEYALPDIILLDIMMPGIDGIETCKRLKKNPITSEIPVIFITALSDINDKIRGLKAGAVDYITKPFKQEEVLLRVNTHLTIQKQKKELSLLNQKLMESNATKDKFFSIIAHDMRGTFTPLLGYANLLVKTSQLEKNEKLYKYSIRLSKTLDYSYQLLQNLLDWSRIQRGLIEFKPEQFDMFKLVENNIQLHSENARLKQIELLHSIQPNTLIVADKNMIDTVLRNLMNNAIKFTYSGGDVSISSQIEPNQLIITVKDTGIGIPSNIQSQLFRIENKSRGTGTSGEQGTGLGLILCKELIEKHHGKLWLESIENKGTQFHFSLPSQS